MFAEIDIEPAPPRDEKMAALLQRSKVMHPGWAQSILPPEAAGIQRSMPQAQPIVHRTPDPTREKFYEMRSLAAKRPFPRNDSELFYRQARFMEDFTDNFEGNAKFNMYFPSYHQMGYDYLRTYFTWRTRVRAGEIRETSLSYIFLYIYELLSGIGVENPADGLSRLMDIWNAFSKSHCPIENYLAKWLKDYHVYYELGHSFFDFVEEHDMQKHYSLTLLLNTSSGGQLALWNALSGYDITKSKFYAGDNEQLLAKCFDAVLGAIENFCKEKGILFEDLLVYSVSRRSPWQPFKNALFGSSTRQNDREVHISKYERYFCKNCQWTANLPIYYSSQKEFIGYIIKKTEACLRNETGYKYKLVAEMRSGNKPFRELQRPAAKRAELDRAIEKAVAEFYKDINRTVVTVDHNSLARIREEALETQEQLIVEDEAGLLPFNAEEAPVVSAEAPFVASASLNLPHSGNDSATEEPQTLSFSDGWKALAAALTDIEREALNIALAGGDVPAFASGRNIMPEVLIDGINEKASDCIGDSIMEMADTVYIFDEYRVSIEKLEI